MRIRKWRQELVIQNFPTPAPIGHTLAMAESLQPPPPAFTPVPVRARRDGWTPARQFRFIAMLAETGSPARAARPVT